MQIKINLTRRHGIAAAAVVFVAALGGTAVAETNHRASVKRTHADEMVELRRQSTENIAALRTRMTEERDAAVEKQKRHDRRVLKRVIRKMKVSRRRAAEQARADGTSQGYSAGSADGYSSGHSEGREEGHEEGLREGSDDLDCSDDPDVDWLPPCLF